MGSNPTGPTNTTGPTTGDADEGTALREAALATGYVNAEQFDRVVNPAAKVGRVGG